MKKWVGKKFDPESFDLATVNRALQKIGNGSAAWLAPRPQLPLPGPAQVSNILLIMARFQALTNNVLDAELEMLRKRLGLDRSQKAELLREVAGLAAWVVRQAEQGREIQARDGQRVEPLVHPALERVRARKARPVGQSLALNDSEIERLTAVLSRPFNPPAGLRTALASLANPGRRPPKLRWKKAVAA